MFAATPLVKLEGKGGNRWRDEVSAALSYCVMSLSSSFLAVKVIYHRGCVLVREAKEIFFRKKKKILLRQYVVLRILVSSVFS